MSAFRALRDQQAADQRPASDADELGTCASNLSIACQGYCVIGSANSKEEQPKESLDHFATDPHFIRCTECTTKKLVLQGSSRKCNRERYCNRVDRKDAKRHSYHDRAIPGLHSFHTKNCVIARPYGAQKEVSIQETPRTLLLLQA